MLPQSIVPAQSCPVHGGRQLGESGAATQEQRGESEDFTGHLLEVAYAICSAVEPSLNGKTRKGDKSQITSD